VYPGMKKIAVTAVAALLAAPALALGKTGVEFDTYPETAKTGQTIKFTVMVFPDGPSGSGPNRFQGRHPLVTFRSKSGRVVRVRASAADMNGIAYGRVAFPDHGPWTTELKVGKALRSGPENSDPMRVGVGLTQTIPAADAARQAPGGAVSGSDDGGFPWVWILSLASIGSALLVLVMRRRGHWGAA
jgi:hypothetical protein